MKRVLFCTLICLSALFCQAQTQSEMNQNAKTKYQQADKELNTVYQKILKDYSKDAVFIKNLKKAQSLWIQFRDAEMKAKYPDREPGYYGSIQPLCWYTYLTELTEERTTKLKIWTMGIGEGDACTGSVKTKN
ncbi:MAG: DUF1311 domain-containing protein [Niastella sp.]|nr:DUF1311 domain-containing protein [Niastella sp.]